MSGECDKCNEHTLECTCRSLSRSHENDSRKCFSHINKALIPLEDGIDPPSELPSIRWINVNGREEHETILRNSDKCNELGIDQLYEITVYLKRWGGWLSN